MLNEKEVYEVLKHISDSDEECATDVVYALTLLKSNINKMLESIKGQMLDVISNNDFDKIDKLKIFCNNIMELHSQIENSINTLISDSVNAKKANEEIVLESFTSEISSKGESKRKSPIDYDEYLVDCGEAHCIDEDFENKKIYGYNFTGKNHFSDTWMDALIGLCNELYRIDPIKFSEMVNNENFKGKTIYYFTTEPLYSNTRTGELRNHQLDNCSIYVYTNSTANQMVKLIKKILKYFDLPTEKCVIYLKADYSSLHKKQNR